LKTHPKYILFITLIFNQLFMHGQHQNKLNVELLDQEKKLEVRQTIVFHNTTNKPLTKLILNDWNHSYSDQKTPLGKRFSDEHYRAFHLAKYKDRGSTNNLSIVSFSQQSLEWCRLENHPDLVEVKLSQQLLPGEKVTLHLFYYLNIPNSKFTRYGYEIDGTFNLKNWFLTPARIHEGTFVTYSNLNLDDIANDPFDVDLNLKTALNYKITTDLNQGKSATDSISQTFHYTGKNRLNFSLYIENRNTYSSFKNKVTEVVTNLESGKANDIQKAIAVDRVVNFIDENLGAYPYEKITVSQIDYDRNPFYGLNQLPSFLNPFTHELLFELKFLKTYTNTFLQQTLSLNPRKDVWLFDAIQIYLMMNYIDTHYPDLKMMGNLSKYKIIKSYHLIDLDFNEQYSYFYLLMARKNLDQAIGDSKDTSLKFNEQISGKYRAGLSLKYLENYLNNGIVSQSIKDFYQINQKKQAERIDFEQELKSKTNKDLDWFFETVIDTRKLIDYKFHEVTKTKDSITATIHNRTGASVPVPIYGLKDRKIVFKEWIDGFSKDSTITFTRKDADKIVLNYENTVPEYNARNNWHSLATIKLANKPYKFPFFQDLEDPHFNQVLWVPILNYNLYDGLMPGIRFYNKTILNRPFTYDINPVLSTKTQSLAGNINLMYMQNNRDTKWYQTIYSLTGARFHYAPDAEYYRLNPMLIFRKRQEDFRDNKKEQLMFRYVMINRENTDPSNLNPDEDYQEYSIFNVKYLNIKTEILSHFSFKSDLQLDKPYGKVSVETEYRNLSTSNRQFNIRWFAGTFLYQTTDTDYYDFGISQVNDYLFDYNLYGRSETSGFFSQQYVVGDAGFKSQLDTKASNKWLTTLNTSYSIWNWIELYGDMGLVKNENIPLEFIYESGIRLNLLTDYFEIYLPIHSSSGWDAGQSDYLTRLRFMFTLNPNTLVGLFTRKWF